MSSQNDTPVKVFHLISSLGRGGRERQVSIIYKYTDKKEFPTKIIYFNDIEQNYIEEYNLSGDLIRIKEHGFMSRLLLLLKLIKKEKPSIIFSWGIPESVLGLLVSLLTGVRFINGSIRHGIRLKRTSHLFRSLILKVSPNIVANSYAGLRVNGIQKGYVLYNGVEKLFAKNNTFTEIEEQKVRLLGKRDDKPIIISVANLVPYKDYFSILKALKAVKESGREFTYIIIGDGPSRDEIIEMINSYHLNDNVFLTGKIKNVNEYLQIADIFLHSSRGEGCSNAILEAMAAGLPVIASDTGGTPEIVDTTIGRLFGYQNTDQLTLHIKELISSYNLRKSLGFKSKAKIESSFSIERMMHDYYSILECVHNK